MHSCEKIPSVLILGLIYTTTVAAEGDNYIDKIIIQRDGGSVGDYNNNTWNRNRNYGNGIYGQRGYSAQTKCPITGAIGTAQNHSSPDMAITMAILDCVSRGGIAECCKEHARLIY